MITVAVLINGQPVAARSAVNVGKLDSGHHEYKLDDGKTLVHRREDGAVKLAIEMLKHIQEVGVRTLNSTEVNGSEPFAEARGSATVYTLAWQQADLAALASVADEIAFARHHHQERDWDEVEHLMGECIKGLEEIKERMFMVRHKLIECESPNDPSSATRRT